MPSSEKTLKLQTSKFEMGCEPPACLSGFELHSVQHHGMWFVAEWRRVVLGAVLMGVGWLMGFPAAASSHTKQADALFAQTGFLHIQIELTPDRKSTRLNSSHQII